MGKSRIDPQKISAVHDYHEHTKHRLHRYAASPGYLDWATQPDPFRTFVGAEPIDLPHPNLRKMPLYDALFSPGGDVAGLDADFIGRLFYHSLALSAWKQVAHTAPWSLRINPSSGALHPTEGYLLSGPVGGLIDSPGVFHYAPFRHRLERRCRLSLKQWQVLSEGLPAGSILIGISSIYWRESWKYGERAFRYCHHDVGHAIGAITVAARVLGWETRVLETIADEDLNRLLGTHQQTGIEAEHADCLLVVYPGGSGRETPIPSGISPAQWRKRVPQAVFTGEPNRLSGGHRPWPVITEVSLATRCEPADDLFLPVCRSDADQLPEDLIDSRRHPAERIIRQRRSAVAMDGRTSLERDVFYRMLLRTLPAQFPFRALPGTPRVSLAIFVHRVDDLAPGLYLLARTEAHDSALRESLSREFEWRPVDECPRRLRLYRLIADDVRRAAKMVSCHQEIAGDGVFSLGMLAAFDAALASGETWAYPRLFWECGLIGQVLYLEAEAAGVRGTGIGCFFDDLMHEMLGIGDHAWQSLYHFTVGGPVEDTRIRTIPPYHHLQGVSSP